MKCYILKELTMSSGWFSDRKRSSLVHERPAVEILQTLWKGASYSSTSKTSDSLKSQFLFFNQFPLNSLKDDPHHWERAVREILQWLRSRVS